MVSRLDRDVGRMLELLERLGIDEETVVIFNSDNGAQSRFDVSEDFFEASGGLRGYKGSMYEGGLRVPQIVRWPGRVEPGTVSDHVTYFPDMMPTFAELAGVESPQTDGISIIPTLTGENTQPKHEWLYWEVVAGDSELRAQAARNGRWKFVRSPIDGPVELYDLDADEAETSDLAAERPDLVENFESWVRENRTEPPAQPARSAVGYTDYVQLAPGGPIDLAELGMRNPPRE